MELVIQVLLCAYIFGGAAFILWVGVKLLGEQRDMAVGVATGFIVFATIPAVLGYLLKAFS